MSTAIFPTSYGARGPGGTTHGDQPMIGFHAIKVRGDSSVAELKTVSTSQWVWLPVPPDGLTTSYSQGWDSATQGMMPSAIEAGVSMAKISGMFGGNAKKGSGGGGVPGSGNEGINITSAVSGLIDLGSEKLKEAGGFVTDFQGNDNYLKNKTVLATNSKINREMIILLR